MLPQFVWTLKEAGRHFGKSNTGYRDWSQTVYCKTMSKCIAGLDICRNSQGDYAQKLYEYVP